MISRFLVLLIYLYSVALQTFCHCIVFHFLKTWLIKLFHVYDVYIFGINIFNSLLNQNKAFSFILKDYLMLLLNCLLSILSILILVFFPSLTFDYF